MNTNDDDHYHYSSDGKICKIKDHKVSDYKADSFYKIPFVSSFKFLYNDDLNHLVFLLENDDDNGEWLEFKDLSRLVDILNHIMTHILDIV
ncbi:hypothetical protein DERP_000293 [Dermatophagoides pteronyssinus]|uniref:Uncharacterized protein n=1 Tax=Dermatophagoides pteronyssinus TaxID=6956 RepID=A0ABQ8IZR4_DERPT|nr:hypothetical protein DERP_000293 [Dermatophagoides pteronyssinus]